MMRNKLLFILAFLPGLLFGQVPIFETQFEKGSYIDRISKTVGTPSNELQFKRTEKGLAIYTPASGDGDVEFTKVIPSGIYSIEFGVKINELNDGTFLIDFRNNGGVGYVWMNVGRIITSSGSLYFDNELIVISTYGDRFGKWIHVVVTGITIDCPTKLYILANQSGGVEPTMTAFSNLTIYEGTLTSQQRAKAYEEFLNAQPQLNEIYPKYGNWTKPTSLNEHGLVAAYNMVPQGNVLVDISGNGYNGTVTGALPTLEGMRFDGVDDNVDCGDVLDPGLSDLSISARIKLIDYANYHSIVSKSAATNGFMLLTNITTGELRYRLGSLSGNLGTSVVPLNQWSNISLTFDRDGDVTGYINGKEIGTANISSQSAVNINVANSLLIANVTTFFANVEIENIKIHNRVLTLNEAIAYHNSFARRPVITNLLQNDPVGSTLPFGFIPGTGTYVVDELTSQDAVLKELDVGTKMLRCTGAGTIAVPSWWAYGTPEFYVYANGQSVVQLINSTNDLSTSTGYRLLFHKASGYIELQERTPGYSQKFITANSYISGNIWYGIKLPRTLDGEFTASIKGGSFGVNYQLIDVTGGSGTNPVTDNSYTTSKFIVLDFDVGDCIIFGDPGKGNPLWLEGVQQSMWLVLLVMGTFIYRKQTD